MTLVIGIATPRGVVVGADGLTSFGNFQTPSTKIFGIGSSFVVGVAGSRHLDDLLARALQQSSLAQVGPEELTQAQATLAARDCIKACITEYVSHTAFNAARPLTEQIGTADLLLSGLCADGSLLVGLDQTANFFPPTTPNYYAIGSGATSALLLLQAYSKYNYAQHPLRTSILLTKRILDMVSAAVAEIGGQLSVAAVSREADAQGRHLVAVDLNDAEIRAGMEVWEHLEEDMFVDLAGRVERPARGPESADSLSEEIISKAPPSGEVVG